MHAAVCNNLQPDLTLLLLPPLETTLARARRRNHRHIQQQGTDENRFETRIRRLLPPHPRRLPEIATREPHRVVAIADEASASKPSNTHPHHRRRTHRQHPA